MRRRRRRHISVSMIDMSATRLDTPPHLQLGELLGLVAGVLRVDELGEEELAELQALRKAIEDEEGGGN